MFPARDTAALGDEESFAPHPLTAEQVAAVADSIGAQYQVYHLVVLVASYTGLAQPSWPALRYRTLTIAQ